MGDVEHPLYVSSAPIMSEILIAVATLVVTCGGVLIAGLAFLQRRQKSEADERDVALEAKITLALAPIVAELSPNSGVSLKDQITRIDKSTIRIEERQTALKEQAVALGDRVHRIETQLDSAVASSLSSD